MLSPFDKHVQIYCTYFINNYQMDSVFIKGVVGDDFTCLFNSVGMVIAYGLGGVQIHVSLHLQAFCHSQKYTTTNPPI